MKYELVAFDLDGVMVSEWSSWEWVHRHFGVDNTDSLDAFCNGEIDDMEFMRRDIELWMRKKPEVRLQDIGGILNEAPMTKGAAETVCALKDLGAKTCIISGGIDLLAEQVGGKCGIDRVMSNGLVADESGKLLGEGILNVELRDKATALRSLLGEFKVDPKKCAAVGNSWVDVSMFEVAGFGIAFNPIDEEVRKAANVIVESDDLRDILPYLV